MFHGAEAYLQMWERAYGVPATSCLAPGKPTPTGLGPIHIGATAVQVLYAAGQPSARVGNTYRYCVTGQPLASDTVVFGPSGTVSTITSG